MASPIPFVPGNPVSIMAATPLGIARNVFTHGVNLLLRFGTRLLDLPGRLISFARPFVLGQPQADFLSQTAATSISQGASWMTQGGLAPQPLPLIHPSADIDTARLFYSYQINQVTNWRFADFTGFGGLTWEELMERIEGLITSGRDGSPPFDILMSQFNTPRVDIKGTAIFTM